MSTLNSKTQAVAGLSEAVRQRMFALLAASYDCVSRRQFLHDLSWKDEVILLTDTGGEVDDVGWFGFTDGADGELVVTQVGVDNVQLLADGL